MVLNYLMQSVVSVDARGLIEYWDINSFGAPSGVTFSMKSETDLYDLAKVKTQPCCVAMSPNGQQFSILSKDKQIRVFDFRRGKLTRKYDESVGVYTTGSPNVGPLDSIELGRRQAIERELEATPEALAQSTLQYDESGHFLLFGSLRGVKILNLTTNKVSRVIGAGESGERFLAVALYQGVPQIDNQLLLARAGTEGGMTKTVDQLSATPLNDPTVFCSSFKKRRFYCLSSREPDESNEARDKLNEMPTEEEKVSSSEVVNRGPSNEAVLRTNLGDIHIKLFANECPKTIENFTTHIRNKYYNGLIFHRVIKGFMLQTGDPKGDGTGGESIWGGEFDDEFVRTLRWVGSLSVDFGVLFVWIAN
jgi:peptidylprolyl isomerase domain and WD repeat-containing protein 1